jgi:hypothetical protein
MFMEDENEDEYDALIDLHAGSCVKTVDAKLWLKVIVVAFIDAVQLAESERIVVRPPVGHAGQLELV